MAAIRHSTRWWAVAILALTVAGGVFGVVVSRDIQPTYAATASVLVGSLDRPDLANDFGTSAMVTAIYGNLIRSESVLEPVIGRLELPTDWQELRDRVHVDLGINEIPIITITVYGRSSADATATARAITDRLLELNRPGVGAPTVQVEPNTAGAEPLTEQSIARVEQRLSRLERRKASLVRAGEAHIQQRIDHLSGVLMNWQDIYSAQLAATSGASNDLQILQPAEPKGGKIRPRMFVNVALGAAIGCLLGFGLLLGAPMLARSAHTRRGGGDPWVRELERAAQA